MHFHVLAFSQQPNAQLQFAHTAALGEPRAMTLRTNATLHVKGALSVVGNVDYGRNNPVRERKEYTQYHTCTPSSPHSSKSVPAPFPLLPHS